MKKIDLKRISILMLSLTFTFIFISFINSDKEFKLTKTMKNQYSFVQNGEVFNGIDTIQTDAFYMSNFEVSNKEYNDFLSSLKENGSIEKYNAAKIDSNNWMNEFNAGFMEPYTEYYHRHSAYGQYPVVNMSLEGAKLYCEWLTIKLNSENTQLNYKIEVRLPTRDEWLRAAKGNNKFSPYSWGGPYLRNAKGQILCNFRSLGAENIYYDESSKEYRVKTSINRNMGVAGSLNDGANITAPINSYWPNDFGIYNMNGNVAELVTDGIACGGSWNSTGYDVRNLSIVQYEKSSSTIGFRPIMIVSKK